MEGRVSRESITSGASPYSAERERQSTAPEHRKYPASPRSGAYRSYKSGRSRKRGTAPQAIPEGVDMLIVQLLASGVLLLVILFVTIIDTSGTNVIRAKLDAAFSKNATLDDVSTSVLKLKSSLTGGAGTVLEIFGGERAKEAPEELLEIMEYQPQQAAEPVESVVIDAETLKEINENAGEAKN